MSGELYKVHRPRKFERVIGNVETVKALQKMVLSDKVPHAILFHGPSGCGKTTLARILRRELECHAIDFAELNCSSFRGIDTVREIMRVMTLAPTGGTCRVWILDEMHMLSNEAQNAALKMLEDPPDHVYFFLCTTDPGKLLVALRNRCTEMPVKLLRESEAEALIERVCRKESITLGKATTEAIIDGAGGSARRVLVMLDKVRNLSDDEQVEAAKVHTEEEAESIELCRALIKKAPWPFVAKILRNIKGEPESIRWGVLMYARSVLISGGKGNQAYTIITYFDRNFYDSKEAGLARACFEACNG